MDEAKFSQYDTNWLPIQPKFARSVANIHFCIMNFRVGQRVRFLHEAGEGVVIRLIDRRTIEVDLGDDFPMEVDVSEVIPVDSAESSFLGKAEEKEAVLEKRSRAVAQLGTSLLEVSLAIQAPDSQDDQERYVATLINPEPADLLFTCYLKVGNRFQGQAAGQVGSGEFFRLFSLPKAELNSVKAFHFQLLSFVPGRGHPHLPLVKELPWNKGRLQTPPRFLPALKTEAWAFSLREDKQTQDIDKIAKSEFIKIKKAEKPVERKQQVEVDLHIEELVKRPFELAKSQMLKVQLDHFEKALNQALLENYQSMVIIHGVGEGVLRKEVRKKLAANPHVKAVSNGDPVRYGNGATLIEFK